MRAEEIRIRTLEERDTEEFLRCKCRSFPEARLANERRRWRVEFEENPVQRTPFARGFVVELDGRIRGTMAYVPFRVQIGDEVVVGACGIDRCVDPELRGLGLGRELMRRWLDPNFAPFAFTYLGIPAELALARKLGATVGNEEIGPIAWQRTLRGAPDAVRPVAPPPLTTTAITGLPGDVDDLWNEVRRATRLTVVHDRAYLAWRWGVVPFGGVTTLRVEQHGRTRGLAFLQDDDRYDAVHLADLLHAPGDEAARCSILRASIEAAAALGRQTLYVLAARHAPPEELEREGFAPMAGEVPRTIVKQNLDPRPAAIDLLQWAPSIGDCDFTFDCHAP